MTPIQQDIQASYVRITQKALSLACGRGDIIQRIAIRAGYRHPEDEEKMLAKLFPSADPAHVVEPRDEPVLAAVMWLMAEGWSDDKVLYKIAEDLGLGDIAVGVALPSFGAGFKTQERLTKRLDAAEPEDTWVEVRAWREWAAKILAAYPWVDEFKPEDSDEKYRDGVRYVLLSIECNGSGSDADNQEMKAIRDRWGFS